MPDEAPLHRIVMVSLAGLSVEAGRKKRSGQITGGERVVRWAVFQWAAELFVSSSFDCTRGLLTWFNPCPSSSSRKVLLSLPLVVCGSFPRCMRFTVLLGLISNSWVRDEAS